VESVESLGQGWPAQPPEGHEEGHVGDAGLALPCAVSLQAIGQAGLEVVANDGGPEGAGQGDQLGPVLRRGVGVVHHHRAALGESFLDELGLAAGRPAVVAQLVLADEVMGGGEAVAVEAALARPLQADQENPISRCSSGV